jgi:CobQ-like glutamine amidotransferase family enzyme
MELTIGYLYPDLCNLFGDKGNILALKNRLSRRNIDVKIKEYAISDTIDFDNIDILYMGACSDKDMKIILEKLEDAKISLTDYVQNGKVLLAVCSGFEMLGSEIKTNEDTLKGLGILDISFKYGKKRCIGNIILKSDVIDNTIVGFENHYGVVTENKYSPLGNVIVGSGSHLSKKTEGIINDNVIATYLHGPLLPKNPALTDYIIKKALHKKYGEVDLSPLDDKLEIKAHDYIKEKYTANK